MVDNIIISNVSPTKQVSIWFRTCILVCNSDLGNKQIYIHAHHKMSGRHIV